MLTMESSQDGKAGVKPPAKNSMTKERGGEQRVLITHPTPFQLLDPNQGETCRNSSHGTGDSQSQSHGLVGWGSCNHPVALFSPHEKGIIPSFGLCWISGADWQVEKAILLFFLHQNRQKQVADEQVLCWAASGTSGGASRTAETSTASPISHPPFIPSQNMNSFTEHSTPWLPLGETTLSSSERIHKDLGFLREQSSPNPHK